ncbi:MAG: phosphoribosylformylglycinamidine synthase subunit PurL [Ardenticatenaceae bacterium]|nr:phosphoribosylformylglycinamidine synthase subunit PurL [Ardenticatenaceae bacterium]
MSNTVRIVVYPRPGESNASGHSLVQTAQGMGFEKLKGCYPARLYFLEGTFEPSAVEEIAQTLLADPVTERFAIAENGFSDLVQDGDIQIDVTYLPGVTDPAAENLVRTVRSLGYDIAAAATGQTYLLRGKLSAAHADQLATQLLSNPVIQQTAVAPIAPPFIEYHEASGLVETVPVTEVDDAALEAISKERRLSMNLAEMQAIRTYFQQEGREPTDIELEMLAQTWSEHCVHKTFRALIDYEGPDGERETVPGILNTYLRAATEEVAKPWVKSAFVDNAGIVAFTDQFDLAFKVETHNHPSALEPFGGANTGIGGVIRDIIGVSARPIANTDVLCFGPQNFPADRLPEGVLHPQRVQTGVIAGIEDYGNKMGIPTVNGAIIYDVGYTANPLVYCGSLGILPVGSHPTTPNVGDLIVAVGGRTGRDGLRGATFSSMEMDTSTTEIAGTAVQIGHPIMEKQTLEVILRARDENLYTAITDCGAGGFSSAVGEMSEELGATVQLKNIPVKYPGLQPWELWLSEAQERMVLAVPAENLARLEEICARQDVEATVLGSFSGDARLQIFYGDRLVGDLSEAFLHDGLPQRRMTAKWSPAAPLDLIPPAPPKPPQWALLKLLAHPNIRSKEDTIRQYDHEVQGSTAVKPLVGRAQHGPSDAAVLVPLDTQFSQNGGPVKAVALANGLCPQFSAIDPYAMAWAAIDEAIRNAVAVGADPDQIAILDNFCWGNPNLPDRLGALVRCAQGCYDAAVAYGTPYISGKDSLNNEYTGADGQKHAIPGTLLISAMGIVPDVAKSITMPFKAAGEGIYLLGLTRDEIGGSHYAEIMNIDPSLSTCPQPSEESLAVYRTLYQAIQAGLVSAAHDCSEGGLAVTLAEMVLASGLGAQINLYQVPTDQPLTEAQVLFSESLGRLVVTVPKAKQEKFEALFEGLTLAKIGDVTASDMLTVTVDGRGVIRSTAAELDQAFRGHTISSAPSAIDISPSTNGSPQPTTPALKSAPKVLILHANGTNRDRDAALACQLAGGAPEIIHMNQLLAGDKSLADYHMLVVPGGFSYGDDLGAGVVWSADLRHFLSEHLADFVASGRPVLGICNGFQALVKSGLLSGGLKSAHERPFTLTYNQDSRFECRWVVLEPNLHSHCLFTERLTEPIYCPVAHGEGRFAVANESILAQLERENRITLTYGQAVYPYNPNGSVGQVAAICNEAGNVMGLMPHPEDHVFPWQHPGYHHGQAGNLGLALFVNGIKAIR